MNCHAARALLDLYAEKRLVAWQASGVEKHLRACKPCSRALASLRPAKAPAVSMPAALKEKLRAALASAAPELPPLVVPSDPARGSGPSLARDALVALVAVLPFASFVGASGVEAATTLGALVAAGALALAALRRGRWAFSRLESGATAIGAAIFLVQLARGALGPSFALPAALARAAGPVLFLAAAVALGGEDEYALLKRALLWTSWGYAATWIFLKAPPTEALGALAWTLAGCVAGLRALRAAPSEVWAISVPLPPARRRGLGFAFAAGLAAAALAPAVWLADDYKLSSAQNLSAFADGRDAALRQLDSIWRFSPVWPAAQLRAAELALKGGDAAGALRRLAAVESAAFEYPGLAYCEGLAYGKLGDWKRALACHQRARAEDPLFVPNLEQLSAAAKSVGDFKLARDTALTVISLEPKDPIHWLALSDIAAREKKANDHGNDRHARRPQTRKKSSL